MYYKEENLFFKGDLYNFLEMKKREIKNHIESEEENYILNIGQEQFIDYLIKKFKIDTIEILEGGIYGDEVEELVTSLYGNRTNLIKKPVIYYNIPFNGDKNLLHCVPSTYYSIFPKAHVEEGKIIKYFVVYEDYQTVENNFQKFKNDLMDYVRNVNADLEVYNSNLQNFISNIFITRKTEFLRRMELKSGLSIPIKKKSGVPSTFSIPDVKVKKKIFVKPIETESNFAPDPTLDDKTYNDILKIINDMGKEFERKPAVYGNKGEEALRDHFLVLLEPHFDGSATGETFNKSGKTDILLRYEGENVFVGECKFWTGEKGFLQTIDQLLGYLTWRDSKTSVIMFVRNKDITSVIETAKESIQKHENFIKFVDEKDGSWFNYIFHLNGDKNKEIKVAVMLYHTPKDE